MEEIKQIDEAKPTEVTQETPGFQRFKKAITESNELVTIVLRTHLLSEYYIDQLIQANISRGDLIVDDNRATYSLKLSLLRATNALEGQTDLIDSAAGLNTVRNNCSHTLDYSITEDDIDKIGKPFGKTYLKNKVNFGVDTKKMLVRTLMLLIAGLDGVYLATVK